MNNRIRIRGFSDENQTTVEGEQITASFEEQSTKKREQAKQFILAKYNPIGAPEEKEFRTTLELQYELREMIFLLESGINEVMNEMGFQVVYLDNKPNWVLYSK